MPNPGKVEICAKRRDLLENYKGYYFKFYQQGFDLSFRVFLKCCEIKKCPAQKTIKSRMNVEILNEEVLSIDSQSEKVKIKTTNKDL